MRSRRATNKSALLAAIFASHVQSLSNCLENSAGGPEGGLNSGPLGLGGPLGISGPLGLSTTELLRSGGPLGISGPLGLLNDSIRFLACIVPGGGLDQGVQIALLTM
ncbi:TPA: hypothetical protein DF272_04255 [Candidatus Falkowbacteria bacterium]|nr:hypothetical protein [Candidatus Falkowbacteria bacterium]